MPDDLSVALERLRTSTQRLNTISDLGAHVVKEVEMFLEQSHVGAPAWVQIKQISDKYDQDDGCIVYLSYCRVSSGKFRIAIVTTHREAQSPDEDVVKPWSECSRDEKIESLGKLPELLVELAARVNEKTDKAEQAMTALSSLLLAVKTRKGGA